VAAAVEKHRSTLTLEKSSPTECKDFVTIYVNDILEKFKNDINLFSPLSRNSCVERSRSRGGAQGNLSAGFTFAKGNPVDLRRIAITNSFAETSAREFHIKSIADNISVPRQECTVRCVDDPLKARIITVEPIRNQRLKQVTSDLNRYLRRIEPFRLLGGENVSALVATLPPLSSGHKYVSGDYSAATDNLNADICQACANCVKNMLPEDLKDLYTSNSGMHVLKYPSGELIDQSNGQLMGSLSSFNNLSMINSAIFSLARSYEPSDYSDWHYVNGDDILFTATPEGLARWKRLTESVGLSPSFGKNYFSKRYFTINSQFFKDGIEIPFVNFRLLKPLGDEKRSVEIGKSGKSRRVVSPEALGSAWRDVCAKAQIELDVTEHRVRRSFLRAHHQDLTRNGKDLLLPTAWGGSGAMTIKESLKRLSLNLYRIRDIAHKTGGAASDSVTRSALAFENTLRVLPPIDLPFTARNTSRTQWVFEGCTSVDTLKTRKPCRHCLSLRPLLSQKLTPAIVGLVRRSHMH
jgi:hypothetical protein